MSVAGELLAWWAASIGVWMLSLSAYSGQDLIVALACAVPCAVMAALARRALGGAWRPPVAVLRWLAVLPWSVVTDAVQVLALPWRPAARSSAGQFRRVPIGGAGETAAGAGRRAMASVLMSSTPGAYVVHTDPQDGTALVHAVSAKSSPIERQVGR